ncbi:MAG: phytanoyl-CoA dioxygenase family protein [Devosia sp.]
MTPDHIRQTPCRTLTEEQRETFLVDGAVCIERAITADWLAKLRAAVDKLVERSRTVTASDAVFDLEPGHTADAPRLRRVSSPCDEDEVFWQVLAEGPVGDIAADLLGPDVKFYQSKLNFKWAKGGAEVKWHQDQPFFPHTNHAVATFGIYLNDCGPEQGPLMTVPGSQNGAIFDHYDGSGRWAGAIDDGRIPDINIESATEMCAPAGSMTVHNYRTVHGSRPNLSDTGRPLLLYVLSAADAMPYTSQPLKSRYQNAIVRGHMAECAHHEPGSYRMPPDWSGGYTSIFSIQQNEDKAA